jgi:hypothetical protein
MHIARSSIVRSLITVVISGCGTGSGLLGIAIAGGGGGGGAAALSFVAQPNSANADQVMSIVEVAAEDSAGTIDTTFTGAIRLALSANSTGAGLSGTTTQRASRGIATFNNLSVDKPGTYTLQASASGANIITSSPFTITAAGTGP